MTTQNNKSKEGLDHQPQDKKYFISGGFIVFFIAVSPLLFYLYKSFPDIPVWKTSYFELETAYGSWFSFSWYITSKFVPLYLMLIWFFTCKHWWHWIILVPISMYTFQLWNILNESKNLDEVEIYYIFPLMMVLVPVVYLIRAKLFNKVRGTDLKAFEEELLAKRTFFQQIKDLFR